ncbi:MAG TPA: DUF4157 domain-containing protein [Pyrinomonadaceae bacterium]
MAEAVLEQKQPQQQSPTIQGQTHKSSLTPRERATLRLRPAPPVVSEALSSPGRPLEQSTRSFMEGRFGHDFGRVRVHTDEQAAASARALGATAYTVGPHIVFRRGGYSPETTAGRRLLAHELAHVVQQGAASNAETSTGGVVQRQQAPDAAPPPQAADGGTGTPVATGTNPPPQPSAGGAAVTPAATGTATPPSTWTPDVPYIWFDLHDSYKALAEPSGPYLYSAYVYKNRVVNPNFSNDLNPAPVRDTTTVKPSGWYAQPNELRWFFYTKFFVDSAASPLPPAYSRFETSANIVFTPSGGGVGFTAPFADNSPQYVPRGSGSSPFYLSTTPNAFAAWHPITVPGVLQWDALLRISRGDAAAEPPTRVEYTAPPQFPNQAAFIAELMRRGVRWRDAAPGERALTFRVTITADGARTSKINVERIAADGTSEGTRTVDKYPNAGVFDSAALVLSLMISPTHTDDKFGSSSDQHVEVRGSQRVRFERPTQQP